MAQSYNSNLTAFRVSEVDIADIAANGLYVECSVTINDSMTSNVAEQATMRCGTIKTVGSPSISITGNALEAGDLSATQASAQQIRTWIQDGTLLYFILQNDAGGSLTAGEALYMAGSGYFNSVAGSRSADEIANFDWEFQPSGTVDLVP